MTRFLPLIALLHLATAAAAPPVPVIAIHGGAGTISPAEITPAEEAAVRQALEASLRSGQGILADGGSALDAVTAALVVLEDSPLFNAGRGAVFTHDGRNELDASVMRGSDLAAGAVGGVRYVKNPVLLARRVMEHSPHVLLTGDGALEFAIREGLALEPPEYFYTERRWHQLRDVRAGAPRPDPTRFGTVGAVALDRGGHLAAATSTGGTTNKRWGRLGDSPIIGAGTYATDAGCAVSATGDGEYFIRAVIAHDICARAEHGTATVAAAARAVIHGRLTEMGGQGGVIALDDTGRVSFEFNTVGMYRGSMTAGGEPWTALYGQPQAARNAAERP